MGNINKALDAYKCMWSEGGFHLHSEQEIKNRRLELHVAVNDYNIGKGTEQACALINNTGHLTYITFSSH